MSVEVLHLGTVAREKSLAACGRDLGLNPQFASPAELQQTVALLTRHVAELRMRVQFLETEAAERNQSCFAWLRERFRR